MNECTPGGSWVGRCSFLPVGIVTLPTAAKVAANFSQVTEICDDASPLFLYSLLGFTNAGQVEFHAFFLPEINLPAVGTSTQSCVHAIFTVFFLLGDSSPIL